MKQVYPNYKERGITTKKLYKKLDIKDKEILDSFLKTLNVGHNKLKDIMTALLQFHDVIEKPFSKINLQDIREYNALLGKSGRKPYTTNGIKVHVKRFLRWHFKDWPSRFDDLKDLKQISNPFNESKINENTLIKKEEIELIMKNENNLTKKTFFITLYESGTRPVELRALTWDKIKFNTEGDLSELSIYSNKTKKFRTVYVKDSTKYLQKLQKEKKNDYVFPSRVGKNQPIKDAMTYAWIRELGSKHLGRDIFPYLARHTRATELYLNTNSKVAQKFLGHGKDMSNFYAHLSSKDVKEAMLKTVYQFDELTPNEKEELFKKINEKIQFLGDETRKSLEEQKEMILEIKMWKEKYINELQRHEKTLNLAQKYFESQHNKK